MRNCCLAFALIGCVVIAPLAVSAGRSPQESIGSIAGKLSFRTSETIRAVSMKGDGKTDNTAVLQQLLGRGDRTLHIPPGDYLIGKISIPSRTILILAPGVVLRDSGRLKQNERLINIVNDDVKIVGYGASVVANRQDYTSGEWRHGVHVWGATRVVIEGLESSRHGGDGFYVGGPPGDPATDILIINCIADGNRRQGLSITSGRRVGVIDCVFKNTRGTAPQCGIDLEPNAAHDYMEDIEIIRPETEANRGGGILINLNDLTPDSNISILILDHIVRNEPRPFRTKIPEALRDRIRYNLRE